MSILKFYENRDIFVTGATGFLGKILLEKLLRTCNARKIYILVRSKKGMSVDERKNELFRCKIFEEVLLKNSDISNQVECIEGNMSRQNLGISSTHMSLIKKNVSVVFHLAASVKFNEPFRDSFMNNVETTRNLIEVCRQMEHLLVLVHASTAYSFCNREEVDEKIYTMSRTYEEYKIIADLQINHSLEITDENILEGRPNTYTLTKAITEIYLNNFCRDLPIIIVRPSIVGCTWTEPICGWNDSLSGPNSLIAAGVKGLISTMWTDEGKRLDLIPADTAINLMLAAAWRKTIIPHRREDEIPVYNCTSGSINPLTWRMLLECLTVLRWNYPSENMFLYPETVSKRNYYWNRVCIAMQHYFPAMLYDTFQVAVRRKPMMMKIYKNVHKTMEVLEYFCVREWMFRADNVEKLFKSMSTQDKQNFNFDISKLSWDKYLENYVLGTRRYVLKEDDSTIPRSQKTLLRQAYGSFQEIRKFSYLQICITKKLKILNFMKRFGRIPLGMSCGDFFVITRKTPLKASEALHSAFSIVCDVRKSSRRCGTSTLTL
ncbi:fatty acyl-CoA reductase 1-like [Centruroides sculpturatus]|uniref:fatty acyl-CoA reductase 1-like n=1 Tax=Centruroides sculpturatus TaxID=218467 RepID=UPI000C6CB0E9|nr:fatty acyl-CoA reductase 1-like [Centruroides sculpturatus]